MLTHFPEGFLKVYRVPHKFHTIEEDLELLVFFAPAEGASRSAT